MSLDRYEHTFDYAFDPDSGDGGFNSDTDLGLIVGHFSKPIAPDMTESYQSIPGRYGGVFLGTNYDEKEFDIPVTIVAWNQDVYNERIRNLSKILINTADEIGTEYPIRFNDDPDVMYYGHFTAIPTPTFLDTNVFDCETTLTFKLADPRGFLKQDSIKVTSNDQVITPKGDDLVYPVIHITPKAPLYYAGFEMNDEYVALGYHVDEGSTTTDALGQTVLLNARQTLQVDDPCDSMATWFEAGSDTAMINLYRGEQDGSATSIATGLTVAKDSKGKYNWGTKNKHKDFYGPVIIHDGLPRITDYWKLSVRMHHEKFNVVGRRAMGKIETYLLDPEGTVRGRMGIEDYAHGRYPCAYIQLGSSFSSTDDAGNYLTLIYDFDVAHQKDTGKTTVKVAYTKVTKTETQTTVKTSGGKVTTTTTTKVNGKVTKKPKVTVTKAKKGAKSTTKVGKPVTKSTKKGSTKEVSSYNQRNNYNNFWGEFMLERQRKSDGAGNYYDNWVASITQWNLKTLLPYSVNTSSAVHVNNGSGRLDTSGKFGFKLANIGVFFGKHDITEDKQSPADDYKEDYETITNYQEWKTDGSDDPDDVPHIIVPAGHELIINTGDKTVTCDGANLDKYVSWLSTFPGIRGGQAQTMHFYPDPENCEDITIDYVPAMR